MHQLALTQAATVLATVRAGEVLPDPVLSLWKDGPAERIEIGALDDETIEELLAAALGGPVDAATVQELAARSRGNPMFLRELVNGALETRALAEAGGLWRLEGPLSPTVRLAELVAVRLGDLSQPERSVLELLALGEPLGPAELTRLADSPAVDALEDKGLITSAADGRRIEIRLAHPVYGDVVRAGISALRERAVSRSLADVIEAVGARRQADPLKVATWRLVGGGGSAGLLVSGALAARARHDYSLTERLARAAIEAGAGFEARFMAAETAHLQGRSDQAEQELAALAAHATSDAEKARVALLRFDHAFLKGSAGSSIIDDTLALITDPFWRDELANRRLFVTTIVSGPREIMELATGWIQRPDSALRVVGLHALLQIGRLDEVIEELTPPLGTRAVPAPDESWHQWMLFGYRAAALVCSGRLREADELLTMAYRDIMDHPAAEARAFVADWFAYLHLEQGRPASAFRRASESYTLYQQLGRSIVAQRSYVAAAHALAMTGRAEQAAETLAALDALPSDICPLQARRAPGPGLGGRRRRRPPHRPGQARRGGRRRRRDRPPPRCRQRAPRPGPPGPGPPGGQSSGGPRRPGGRRVRGGPRRLRQRGSGERRPGSSYGLRSLRGTGRPPLRGRGERRSRRRAATRRTSPGSGGRREQSGSAAEPLRRSGHAGGQDHHRPVPPDPRRARRRRAGRRRPFEQANCR